MTEATKRPDGKPIHPRPWKADRFGNVMDADGYPVSLSGFRLGSTTQSQQMTADVLSCVNRDALFGEMVEALTLIASEAGQYADGADDAHYLAKEMARLEALARGAIAFAKARET